MSNPQAVIPDSFAALANLTRALEEFKKTQATPQGPAGPTVAMQATQAAQQAAQPSAPQPPEGQPAPPPGQPQPQQNGIAGIAQNAGIGAQIQAQQQQAAQQAMMAQAQQAQQPQQMAKGGIAGLNTHNMRGFKEGGVLGFARGEEVPDAEPTAAELEAASKAAGLLRQAFEKPAENVDLQRAKTEAARANAILNQYGIIKKQNDPQGLEAAQKDADAARKELLSIISNQFYGPQGERKNTVEGQKDTRDLPNAAPTSMIDTRDVQSSRPPVAQAAARPVQQTPRPPAQTGPEAVEAMMERMQKYAPGVDTTEQRAEINRLKQMRADQPLAGIEQLAAYRRAQEEYDTAAKERKESFGSRQFRELMRDMSMNRNGEGMARLGEEERKLTEADTTRRLTNAQLSGLIVDAQNAKKVGDQEKYIAAIKDVNTILKDNADRKAQISGQAGTIGANLYNTETMANLDRIKIGTMSEANKLAKEAHSLNEFNSSLSRFNANKQAMVADLDKTFNKKTEDLIKMAQVDPEKKKEYIALEAQHEAYKNRQVQSINDQIYKTELAMYKQHGQGMPAPVNQNSIAANAPALTGFTVTKESK